MRDTILIILTSIIFIFTVEILGGYDNSYYCVSFIQT